MPFVISNNQKEYLIRYLAARNFMLSGTALLRGMTYSYCEELGTFKPSFHHQSVLIFWNKRLIWFGRCPLFLYLKLLLTWMAILSQFLCVFSNSFKHKNKGHRPNQINFLLKDINACDEMKTWKSLTPRNMNKSYPSKMLLYLIAWNS